MCGVCAAILKIKEIAGSAGKLYFLVTAASSGIHLAEAILGLGDCICHEVVGEIEAVDMINIYEGAREREAVIYL